MLTGAIRFLRGDEFSKNHAEVHEQNRHAITYFATAGVPLSILNAATQSVIGGLEPFFLHALWLPLYYVALLACDRLLIPADYESSTGLMYWIQAPVLLVSILLGTIWDPSNEAVTFLVFVVLLPVFILDRPARVLLVTSGWTALFCMLCVCFKEPQTIQADLLHVLQFYLSSMTVTCVVLKLRLEVLRNARRMKYHLEHDTVTDAQNNRCLYARAKTYVGRPLIVVLGDVEHFSLLNDFYGHDIANSVLASFAAMLKEVYGPTETYHYGGDEMLCISLGADEDSNQERMRACQRQFSELRTKDMYSRLSCTFGYVMGTPTSEREFHQMVQLANIYAHQATKRGEGNIIGGPYDEEKLRAGIVESNIATHARAYEINQLTGLPSMAYFITHSEQMLGRFADLERRPVIGLLNLVHFHDYNDRFGYARGDELIRAMADILRRVLPNRHITYITGSQFGIMCYIDEIEPTMGELASALNGFTPGFNLQVHGGFVEYHEGDSVISLLDKAKLAHDSIDGQKNQTYRIYDPRLDEEVRFRQYLITHVDEALEKEWVKVYYQPIVHASSGEICNMEALSRWDDPTYGFLPPFKFISVLENEHLIYKLTLYVVKRIMRDFAWLELQGIPLVPVSVNVSRTDFFEADMVNEIARIMDDAGYSHRLLDIEITESAFAQDQGRLKEKVDRFRAMGFAVWMDDFGSEYSTLSLLENLNFDLIKVDMQFMRNFATGGRNASILSDIIGMCRRLGITTLVEGVETEEQFNILRQLGTDKLQGYLFSRPAELEELVGSMH